MTQPTAAGLVAQVHAAGRRCVMAVTGGGSRAVSALLSVPGASQSVLEAVVPYAPTALADWVGGTVEQACSEATARAMAMRSFRRATQLAEAEPAAVCGIGATASLATTRPKRGGHRVHVAWQSATATVVYSCELLKGARSRDAEEGIAAELVLHAVAEACGVAHLLRPALRASVVRREKRAPPAWTDLLIGRCQVVAVLPVGEQAEDAPPRVILPGAFNPLHTGHRRMADMAAARCGTPTTFELSIENVDKPPLDFLEIDQRLGPLQGERVLLTRAATFVEKAALARGAVFVVGTDTIRRIGAVRYYGDDASRRDAAIDQLADHGCRFLVFGRLADGRFETLSDITDLPPRLRRLCEEVPETEFREDVSSSALRGTG